LADFKIISSIDNKEFNCSKVILATQSQYFLKKFKNYPSEHQQVLDFSSNAISACVQMLYTGEPIITDDNVEEVLTLANELNITAVKTEAVGFIMQRMSETNCVDFLKVGDKLKNDDMVNISIQFIAERFTQIEEKFGHEQLYELPIHLFKMIFESDKLLLRSKVSGVIYTGVVREFQIIMILDNYIRTHSELTDAEMILSPCVRLSNSIFDLLLLLVQLDDVGSSGLHDDSGLHGAQSQLDDILNLQKDDYMTNNDGNDENSDQDSENTKRYVTLLQTHKNYGSLKIANNSFDEMVVYRLRKQIVDQVSRPFIEELQSRRISQIPFISKRKLSKSTCLFTFPVGSAWATYSEPNQVMHFGIIRKIRMHSRLHGHQVILKGLELYFEEDSTKAYSMGLEDGQGTAIDEFVLEVNEHICAVKGRSEAYINQLCFITNKGRLHKMGGNQCTRAGEEFSSVKHLLRKNQSDVMIPLQHMYLKGICSNPVRTNEGVFAMAQVQFCFDIISNSSVKFRQSNHDLAVHALRTLDY
jgi:hypothetical protein